MSKKKSAPSRQRWRSRRWRGFGMAFGLYILGGILLWVYDITGAQWAHVAAQTAMVIALGLGVSILGRRIFRRTKRRRLARQMPPPPAWPTWSRNAVRRTGDAVRDGVPTKPGDPSLEKIIQFHGEYATWVENVIRRIDFASINDDLVVDFVISSRAKSLETVREKLRRERGTSGTTNLSTVRDLAGVRIVGDFSLIEQDMLAKTIVRTFSPDAECHIADRRTDTSHGYRALHIELRHNGWRCEVQVRTRLQHVWANEVESFADLYGRQIRYGQDPDGYGVEFDRRVAAIRNLQELSEIIQRFETLQLRSEVLIRGTVMRALRGLRRGKNWKDPKSVPKFFMHVWAAMRLTWDRQAAKRHFGTIEDMVREAASP